MRRSFLWCVTIPSLFFLCSCTATLFEGRVKLELGLPAITLPQGEPFDLLGGLLHDILGGKK
jgi:hypothetical protein